jgi:hypothetical protein
MSITRFDVKGADLSDLEFVDVSVATLLVDSTTKFGMTLPKVAMIYSTDNGEFKKHTTPNEIESWLTQHSALTTIENNSLSYQDAPIYRLYDRVCRHSMKKTFIWPKTNKPSEVICKDRNWSELKKILNSHNLIEENTTAEVHVIQVKTPYLLLNPQPNTPQDSVKNEVITLAKRHVE